MSDYSLKTMSVHDLRNSQPFSLFMPGDATRKFKVGATVTIETKEGTVTEARVRSRAQGPLHRMASEHGHNFAPARAYGADPSTLADLLEANGVLPDGVADLRDLYTVLLMDPMGPEMPTQPVM